jgi:hypothetical protein
VRSGKGNLAFPAPKAANYTLAARRIQFGATPENSSIGDAESAVDEQHVSGDVIRGAGGEEYRRAGDFGRLAPAPGRVTLLDPGVKLGLGYRGRFLLVL